MFENATKNGTLEIRGTKFKYEIYYSPIQHQESIKEDIINRYGSRLHNGQICLGITKDVVRNTMNANDYHVIAFVKNNNGLAYAENKMVEFQQEALSLLQNLNLQKH